MGHDGGEVRTGSSGCGGKEPNSSRLPLSPHTVTDYGEAEHSEKYEDEEEDDGNCNECPCNN